MLLKCTDVSKRYKEGERDLTVLKNISLELNSAEQVAIVGASGSGKSTLLHILGALDKPTAGTVTFNGDDIFAFSEREVAQFRNQHLGFVYQQHHLLPEFDALENVAMPCLIAGMDTKQAKAKASELLHRVGLEQRFSHRPAQLSGGERQRVAIARALVMQPQLVLADEPTGNLDDTTGEDIYELLLSLKQDLNTSFLVVTHDQRLANKLDRKLLLHHGVIEQGD
ncbi:MAG: lipoprotein-releasing ABC transporter ATP-binding protein LolD [Aestuariibacter sp.]